MIAHLFTITNTNDVFSFIFSVHLIDTDMHEYKINVCFARQGIHLFRPKRVDV